MVIQNTQGPEELVDHVLLGEGITAESISMNGVQGNDVSMQLGYFNATNSNIGLSHGIILATGGVSVAESPNDIPTAFVNIPDELELNEEPDLEQIMSPAELNDAAVLEFDFTAKGDTLRFRYVFASEEYNEHTCTPYNDAFGFFISGPGIVGDGSYENNAKNVALVPGTNVPVAINTVNQGFAGEYGSNNVCNAISPNWQENSVYFVNNEDNTALTATQFDGFTVPFLVEIPVVCGGTYHIKIAIADAVDGKNDSAVFIEAESFESEAPLEASLELVNPQADGYAMEGCSSLAIELNRPDSSHYKTVYLRAGGADNLESIIPDLPDSVVFNPMQGSVLLDIPVLHNTEFESLRTVDIELLQLDVCAQDTTIIDLTFDLIDAENLLIEYQNSFGLDCEESAQISLSIEGGHPPYQVNWEGPQTGTSFEFELEGDSETLAAEVRDACGVHIETVEIEVYREDFDPLNVAVVDEVFFNCVDLIELEPVVNGGEGTYTFTWLLDDEIVSTEPAIAISMTEENVIQLEVADKCVPAVSKSIQVTSNIEPLVVSLGPDTVGSCAEIMTLVPSISGGFGAMTYEWRKNQNAVSSNSTFGFVPGETSMISVKVEDQCDQEGSDDMIVYMGDPPLNTSLTTDTVICRGEPFIIEPEIQGGYGQLSYYWNGRLTDQGLLTDFPDDDRTYTLEVRDECNRAISHEINLEVREVTALFEFLYEDPNERWIRNLSTLDCNYLWRFPDLSESDQFQPVVDVKSINNGYTWLYVVDDVGCESEYRLKFEPSMHLYLPNAFTPDGDGLNDVFKAEGMFISEFEIAIFNQWGDLVFESNDIEQGWNGEDRKGSSHAGQDNVYNYRYKAVSWTGAIEEGVGRINLLR